jgi:hypothetical protein
MNGKRSSFLADRAAPPLAASRKMDVPIHDVTLATKSVGAKNIAFI